MSKYKYTSGMDKSFNKDELLKSLTYLMEAKDIKPNTKEHIVIITYNAIVSQVLDLTTESPLELIDSLIKQLDVKSKGFINSTDATKIPLIGKAWDLFNINKAINDGVTEDIKAYEEHMDLSIKEKLSEHDNRIFIQHLYGFVTVSILHLLVSKLIHLKQFGTEDELLEAMSFYKDYLRKIDPRYRKFIRGSRINIIDKIYSGFDTEFETKEYGKVTLLSYQTSNTGTIVIRVNNSNTVFDFTKIMFSDGSLMTDYNYQKVLDKYPILSVINSMINSVLLDLRDTVEDSSNNDFINKLNSLHQRNLIMKIRETDDLVEFMVPLKEDDSGIISHVDTINYQESGKSHPSLLDIINIVESSVEDAIKERYDYFISLLKDSMVVDNLDNSIKIDYFSEIDEIDEFEDDLIGSKNITNLENLVNMSKSENMSNNFRTSKSDLKVLLGYKNKRQLKEIENPFHKDNDLPSSIPSEGKLRGGFRRNKIVILGCHFSIADLSVLSDFKEFKVKFDSVQNTMVTITKPYVIKKGTSVFLRDTMLLSPAGSSLGFIGNLYKLQKVNIGDYITRMSVLRNENEPLFREYALRDSLITLRHIIEMERASLKITGLGIVPSTISSLARRFVLKVWEENKIDLNNFIYYGKYQISDFQSIFSPKGLQSTGLLGRVIPMFLSGSRGGRNESYAFGINKDKTWYDNDLVSAYTTAMSLLGLPDINSSYEIHTDKALTRFLSSINNPKSKKIIHTIENSYSMFHVIFEFKEGTKHPCLPVSSDETSIVYPLEGETIATGYELYLAKQYGCKIRLIKGVVVPFQSNGQKPYLLVHNYLQSERVKYSKESFYNLMYKLLGNSVYGQTCQGFNTIKKLNTRTGSLENMGTSVLSNPLISSHTTGLIRAVLGEIIRQTDSLGGDIVSCTTDGFICNIEDLNDKLDYNSRLLGIYSNLRLILSGKRDILELKDSCKGIISWSTRGQLSLDPSSKISAMTGFQPRNYSMKERIDLIQNAFETDSFTIPFGQQSLRKVNDIYREGGHVTSKITEKNFRVVFDNRREVIDTGLSYAENLLFTKPFQDKDCISTIKLIGKLGGDVYAPKSGYSNKAGSKDYKDIAVRSFVRALTQSKLNLINPFDNYQEVVDYLNSTIEGVKITPNYIALQKRRTFIPKLVPLNNETRQIVESLKLKFPQFDETNFFR